MRRKMILSILLSLIISCQTASAVDIADKLEDGCYTEISFFCPRTEPKVGPWLKCLAAFSDSITSRCTLAIQATKVALAPKPPPVAPAAPAATPGAPQPAAAAHPKEMDARLTRSEKTVYVHLAGS